jgi:acetate kinase
MAMETLILSADPGSASRKYALFNRKGIQVAQLHFEFENSRIICSVKSISGNFKEDVNAKNLEETPKLVEKILKKTNILNKAEIKCIGLRVVAPTIYFLKDRLLDEKVTKKLQKLESKAPLHIRATLQEANCLKENFKNLPIVLISDSGFHTTKPDYARNYAIPIEDADKFEIKRYGYHGISVASIVRKLNEENILSDKLVVCHLGSGASVTAVKNGKSIDNTMGYSPLEGLIMSTRSGSIDIEATLAIKNKLEFNDRELENYLNKQCGLKGISGTSDDIRELIEQENNGNKRAQLALTMYVYRVRQAIAQMTAAMEGVDSLVFTGTVGERSSIMRNRITEGLLYLNFAIDKKLNDGVTNPEVVERISLRTRQKPIFVIPTDEQREIARRAYRYVHTVH